MARTPVISVDADGTKLDLDLNNSVESQLADELGDDLDEDMVLTVEDFGDLDSEAMESFPWTIKNTIALGELMADHHDVDQVCAAWLVANDRISKPDVDDAKALLENLTWAGSMGEDETDYAQYVVDEELMGDKLDNYFDYESFGRDLMADARQSELKGGRVVIWNKT